LVNVGMSTFPFKSNYNSNEQNLINWSYTTSVVLQKNSSIDKRIPSNECDQYMYVTLNVKF